jgi:hypothetical protein
MYAVDAADTADLGEFRTAARDGRAAAATRRRQLSQGKQALNRAGAAPAAEDLANGGGASPAATNGQGAPDGTQGAPEATAVPADPVAAAQFGRAISMQRRRQLSQGKVALNGGGTAPTTDDLQANGAGATLAAAGADGQGAPNGTQGAPPLAAAPSDGVAAAHLGRAISMQRRRQISQGKVALDGAGAGPRPAASGQGGPSAPSDGVAAAHLGRAISMQRRRQISQGKVALDSAGAGPRPAAASGQGGPSAPSDGVAAAHLGRAISMQRRRQMSQGKVALDSADAPPAGETPVVDGVGTGREQARALRAEASHWGGAVIGRPEAEGHVAYAPKVIVSPTERGQGVTGLRIGPGARVTGDEPGAALPVTGTQYVGADGSAPAMGAGPKVGQVRTSRGLIVSGTTVRSKVPITGDEFGEHLPITGEADQKLDDDLTARRDGTYRQTQFPRRADPHGATAVGTRLGPQRGIAPTSGDRPWLPLENTDKGWAVTGTAVGRSGRVTGNEAGACRPITGDQYQNIYSSECGGIGGGTTPAAHLNRARLDPATLGKVTVAQTWGGQVVTGPSVEHRPNVTGDEPGSCRPVTGTPYQGPSTAFGWCEPDEAQLAARRLDPRPEGVAVTGDLPTTAEKVTGTERGERNDITGSSYYGEMRPAEPAADDATRWQDFSVPVALARRLAGRERDGATQQAPPASCVPGRITGSFAIGEGMVTGNNEFLFRPRLNRDARRPVAVTGEGEIEGRPITGSPAAWKPHDKVTGTEGYIAAGRNPSEGGGGPNGWAGARRFKKLATPGSPTDGAKVTGRVGGSPKDAARVTLSGGAQG